MSGLHRILVAVDGSASADRALETAIDLAKLAHASLLVVAVVPPHYSYYGEAGLVPDIRPEERRWFGELVSRCVERARSAGVGEVSSAVPEGSVVDQLLTHIEESRPDLVVLGARGLSAARRLFVGSVSDAVLHHAHTSVLIVRPAATGRDRPGKTGT